MSFTKENSDQCQTPSKSCSILAFQKSLGSAAAQVPNLASVSAEALAKDYYAMSSLVSYMTLQSRYIVPPDIKMDLSCTSSPCLGDQTMDANAALYIGPSDKGVYEFPPFDSMNSDNNPSTEGKTMFISWVKPTKSSDLSDAVRIDTDIQWGDVGASGPLDFVTSLDTAIPLPKVIKSNFFYLEDTPEIYNNTKDISANKQLIADLEDRITRLETFLSTFITNQIDPDTQSNYYLGLQNLQSVTSPSWKDLSSSGVWRQLV